MSKTTPRFFQESPEAKRFTEICGLLSRPKLKDAGIHRVRLLLDAPEWRPVPVVRSIFMIEPLMRHHLIALGIDPAAAFDYRTQEQFRRIEFADLALNYHAKRRLLNELAHDFEAAGVESVLLVKGAALAPRYPQPALRPMSDIDLILRHESRSQVDAMLRSKGWRLSGPTWLAKSGHQVDISFAQSPLSKAIWSRALEDRSLGTPHLKVSVPDSADLLLHLAIHAVQHAGSRIWQDFADAHLLLDEGRESGIAATALRRALQEGGVRSLIGFLMVYDRLGQPQCTVFSTLNTDPLPADAMEGAEALAGQFEAMAIEALSATEIAAVLSFARPRRGVLRRVIDGFNRATPASAHETEAKMEGAERDRLPTSFFSRQAAKLRLVWQLFRGGRLRHALHLARGAEKMKRVERVFSRWDSSEDPPGS